MIKKGLTYCLLLLFSIVAKAQQYSETELKAAYIYNLTLFVDLPHNSIGNQFVIAVYGDEKMFVILREMLKERKTHDKQIKVINITDKGQLNDCNLIYISKNTQIDIVKKILKQIENKPVLTVGDRIENFCQLGGLVNFLPNFYHKRFEINNEKALSLGIKISSKLLILSKIIRSNENRF